MGYNENFASDYEPSRVAEADKAVNSIGIKDVLSVLTNEERVYLELETKANARFSTIQKDSELTDLTQNFLVELANTGSCSSEMETLDHCLKATTGLSDF